MGHCKCLHKSISSPIFFIKNENGHLHKSCTSKKATLNFLNEKTHLVCFIANVSLMYQLIPTINHKSTMFLFKARILKFTSLFVK